MILTAEGTASGPYGVGGRNISLRRLEMTVRRPTVGIQGDVYGGPANLSGQGSASDFYTQTE